MTILKLEWTDIIYWTPGLYSLLGSPPLREGGPETLFRVFILFCFRRVWFLCLDSTSQYGLHSWWQHCTSKLSLTEVSYICTVEYSSHVWLWALNMWLVWLMSCISHLNLLPFKSPCVTSSYCIQQCSFRTSRLRSHQSRSLIQSDLRGSTDVPKPTLITYVLKPTTGLLTQSCWCLARMVCEIPCNSKSSLRRRRDREEVLAFCCYSRSLRY